MYSESEILSFFYEVVYVRLGLNKTAYIQNQDYRLSESEMLYFRSVVKRLLQKEPLQYILGIAEFCGLDIQVDNRVLIPRPETAELVNWLILENQNTDGIVYDLCTGSGCIALALKRNFIGSEIVAVDVSSDALSLAVLNAEHHNLDVHFVQSDILKEIPFAVGHREEGVNIIVSNPPYVLDSEKLNMQENVLGFEPHLALFVPDNDPLLFYRRISELGKHHLQPNGKLYFETNELYAEDVANLLKSMDYLDIEIRRDLQGKMRMIRGKIGNFKHG
jgi:release factor glutamine methyltransferase